MNLFSIQCSWPGSACLEKCLSVIEEEKFKGFDEETLDAANCTQLNRPDSMPETEPLNLCIDLKDPTRVICGLIIVSQSKRIELFQGSIENPGSYQKTLTGTISEESDDDFKVFTINETLSENLQNRILLKFPGIENSCWILSLNVVFRVVKPSFDRFDLQNLDPNLPLSDKAKDFKKLFETFQKTKSPSLMIPPSSDLMMAKLDPESIKSMISAQALPNKNQKTDHECDKCIQRIDRFEKEIRQRLDAQDAKLDEILSLLKKQE